MIWIVRVPPAITLAVAFLACSGSNVIGPENELEVTNATDSFQWQASDLDDVTQILVYDWRMTGSVANVNHSSALSGGSATLTIQDATGAEVYRRSLAENDTFETSAGRPGQWTVDVILERADGTLNFRVQKP